MTPAPQAARPAAEGATREMPQKEIQDWLTYWQNASMVNIDAVRAFDQVHQARKFCSCMRIGIFADVSDLDIWRALENLRTGKYPEPESAA